MFDLWAYLFPTAEALSANNLWQGIILIALWIAAKTLDRRLTDKSNTVPKVHTPKGWFLQSKRVILFWALLMIASAIAAAIGVNNALFVFCSSLLGTWTVIGLATSLMKDRFVGKTIFVIIYIIIGYYAFTWEDNLLTLLREIEIVVGTFKITAWGLLTGIIALSAAIWISLALAQLAEIKITSMSKLSASNRVLIVKSIRIILLALAFLVGIQSMGLDLSFLAFFGGAFGLGVGFGLQKIISNLVSGFILLSDKSIKPGDVIEVDETYGWINNLQARYVSVLTRDGTEHLIPNEDLITQRVTNWSFSNDQVRLRCPIGISYQCDPHKAIAIAIDIAKKNPRILDQPPPRCLLKGFGDNSVDLELRIWINDPAEGVANIKSAVLLEIWDRFKEENIEIPFPQRDLHIRSAIPLKIERPAANDESSDPG